MKKAFLRVILFCVPTLVFANTDLIELKALLSSITSLQASFQQTVKSEQGRVLQRLSGKVWLKKPAQFRWEVLEKEPRLVISDGKNVWDFDKDLEQVIVQKLNKGQTRAPIFFLTGDADMLDKDFIIARIPLTNGTCLKLCNACFELKPKRQEGSFQWIRIGFKNKLLTQMELLDQLGQYSVFSFKNIKLNENIPTTRFRFTPPRGVDVLIND